jgi:hypothetical protein
MCRMLGHGRLGASGRDCSWTSQRDPDVLRLRAPNKIRSLVIGRDARANATDSGGTQCGENGILPLDTL